MVPLVAVDRSSASEPPVERSSITYGSVLARTVTCTPEKSLPGNAELDEMKLYIPSVAWLPAVPPAKVAGL